jgi:hypothetical protein
MDDLEAKDEINKIIQFAMGPLANWQRPATLKSVGPAFPEVFVQFEKELEALRLALRDTLGAWAKAEDLGAAYPLSETFNPLFDPHGRHRTLAKRLAAVKSHTPQDFVGGWSVSGKEIELSHWRGIPALTVVEATLLSVGRDPRFTNFDGLFKTYGRSEHADELLYFLEDRQEQIAKAFGLDPEDSVSVIAAADFLRWVNESAVVIDDRFRRMLRERWADIRDETSFRSVSIDLNDQVPHGNSRKAYARLVTSIAIQRYGLTQEREIGRVANKMQDDTDLAGLGVQSKPIRDLLRLGWSMLPSRDRPS